MPEIFDLDNAFVYYVDRILPGTPGSGFADIISVINSSRVDLALVGTPTYSPSPNDPTLPTKPSFFFLGDFCNETDSSDVQAFSETISETASFSFSFTEGLKVGAKTTVTTKIPFVAEGKVELSAEGSFSSTQTDTTTKSQSFTVSQTINVPAHKRVVTTARVDVVQYKGNLTAKVRVNGRISINFGSTSRQLSVADVFKAIKNQPPGNYSKRDQRTTYTFTDSDLARFEITPDGQVSYTATAAVDARFGLRVTTKAKQYEIESGLQEREFTL